MLVDPEADPDHSPRPMIEAVVSVARRCGVEAVLSPAVDTDSVVLDLLLTKPDVVVIVVQGEVPRFGAGSESHYAWDRPARLTRALREAGTPVIALSVGASAAALAVCVEQGAIGLLHTDLLSQELARQTARRLNGNGGGTQSGSGYEDLRGPGQLPAPYNSLVHLTPSERRVLFHMMEGRSAAEIAATLVVSLTTVRSHIRSILRKLNVNSQLAAVALAFGTLPDQALAE
jgi:DNA-binding NarL/FixJ family response regulator